MSEINYNYQHEDFNLQQAYYYTLILQVSRKYFTYAVVYDDKLMALATQCDMQELANPTEMVDELFANYRDVVVGVDADAFTLVPISLYREGNVADYALFLDVKQDEKVLAQQLDADNFIIYKTHEAVIEAIERFDLSRSVYSSKGWINAIAGTNPADDTIHLNIEEDYAEFLLFKNGKLRLYNTFEYKTGDDLAYSTAMVYREAGLKQSDLKLSLSGVAAHNSDYRNRLSEFFPVVELNTLRLAQMPAELDLALLKLSALLLCVSSEAR